MKSAGNAAPAAARRDRGRRDRRSPRRVAPRARALRLAHPLRARSPNYCATATIRCASCASCDARALRGPRRRRSTFRRWPISMPKNAGCRWNIELTGDIHEAADPRRVRLGGRRVRAALEASARASTAGARAVVSRAAAPPSRSSPRSGAGSRRAAAASREAAPRKPKPARSASARRGRFDPRQHREDRRAAELRRRARHHAVRAEPARRAARRRTRRAAQRARPARAPHARAAGKRHARAHAAHQFRVQPLPAPGARPRPAARQEDRAARDRRQTELDKTVLEKIGDPLVHLVRNSIDHGIESPEVRLAAGKSAHGTIELQRLPQGRQRRRRSQR